MRIAIEKYTGDPNTKHCNNRTSSIQLFLFQELVRQQRNDVKSFRMQFKKEGRGLLREAFGVCSLPKKRRLRLGLHTANFRRRNIET